MKPKLLLPKSVYRRLAQFSLSLILLLLLLNMWLNISFNGNQMQFDALSEQTRQLTRQSALAAQQFMTQKQPRQLSQMLNNLTTNPYIDQSMIYDHNGKELARSDNAMTTHQYHLARIDDSAEHNSNNKVYISEIENQDRLIGYLRINYQQRQALQQPQQHYHHSMQKIGFMLLLAGTIGFMLSRALSRFSWRTLRRFKSITEP